MRQVNSIYVIILLVIVAVTIYGNSLKGEFVWDDERLVVKNPYIKNWNNLRRVFTLELFYNKWGVGNYYRPLQTLSFMSDYSLWKLNPFGYRLTNVLLHTLCSICVYYLILLIAKDKLISLITSLFFLTHPAFTALVSYISGRADLIAGVFFISSITLYIKSSAYNNPRKIFLYSASILSYVLALMSKEMTITLPLIILLYDFTFCKEDKLNLKNKIFLRYLAFFIVTIIYIFLRLTILNFPGDAEISACQFVRHSVFTSKIPLYLRLLTFCKVIFIYLGIILMPVNLHMERSVSVASSMFNPNVLLALLTLSFILIVIIKSREYSKIVFFGLSWFFITLFPISNIVPLLTFLAEHWLYFPFIGLAIAGAVGINKLSKYFPKTAFFFFLLILIFYSARTVNRNNDWATEIGIYTQTLKYSPNNHNVHYNLGNAYRNKKMYEAAIKEYNLAIALKPTLPRCYNNLGYIYEDLGDINKAISLYNKAKQIDPKHSASYVNLGNIYFKKGLFAEAVEEYKKALEIEPYDHEIWSNLGDAYRNNENFSAAIEVYKKTLKLNPRLFNVRNNLGAVYLKENRLKEAINEYKIAIKLNPNSPEAHFNLGIACVKSGDFENAKREWKMVLEINPNLKSARDNLKALEDMGY